MTVAGIEIEVVRKKIKNINLSVLAPDGRVRVSAPKFVSDREIAEFVTSKLSWLEKHRKKYENYIPPKEKTFESGEGIFLFGKEYILQTDEKMKRGTVRFDGEILLLGVRPEDSKEKRKAYLDKWMRAELDRQIAPRFEWWEARTGLYSSGYRIKDMKTRWGTCNVKKKNIWFGLQLAHKPPECIEYVILHELAHIKEKNHGKAFTDILDFYMSDWREIKKKLNTEN